MSKTLTLAAGLFIALLGFLMFRQYHREDHPVLTTGESVPTAAMREEGTSVFRDWREFEFKPGHFKVFLPGLPQHVADTIIDQKTQEPHKYETFAVASDSGAAFMINAITLSDKVVPNEETLRGVVRGMLERNKDNTLNKMTSGSFHGLRALDFSFNKGDILVAGKVFAYGDTIYILSMLNGKDVFDKKELDFFISSFHIIEDEN